MNIPHGDPVPIDLPGVLYWWQSDRGGFSHAIVSSDRTPTGRTLHQSACDMTFSGMGLRLTVARNTFLVRGACLACVEAVEAADPPDHDPEQTP
jgi:hypothetical protein